METTITDHISISSPVVMGQYKEMSLIAWSSLAGAGGKPWEKVFGTAMSTMKDHNHYATPNASVHITNTVSATSASLRVFPNCRRQEEPLAQTFRVTKAKKPGEAPRRLTAKEDGNFVCEVEGCNKVFNRSYNFKAHMEARISVCLRSNRLCLYERAQSQVQLPLSYTCRKDTMRRCSKRFDVGTLDLRAEMKFIQKWEEVKDDLKDIPSSTNSHQIAGDKGSTSQFSSATPFLSGATKTPVKLTGVSTDQGDRGKTPPNYTKSNAAKVIFEETLNEKLQLLAVHKPPNPVQELQKPRGHAIDDTTDHGSSMEQGKLNSSDDSDSIYSVFEEGSALQEEYRQEKRRRSDTGYHPPTGETLSRRLEMGQIGMCTKSESDGSDIKIGDLESVYSGVPESWLTDLPHCEYGSLEGDRPLWNQAGLKLSAIHVSTSAKAEPSPPNLSYSTLGLEKQDSFVMESDEDFDSDSNDSESILSEAPSLASPQSSVPTDLNLSAISELRAMLLTNEALKPLYNVATSKAGPGRFQRNLRRFLLRYGHNNYHDFVVASGRENESGYSPEEAARQTLNSVKTLMLASVAFTDLCFSMRIWLNLKSAGPEDLHASTEDGAESKLEPAVPLDSLAGVGDDRSDKTVVMNETKPEKFTERPLAHCKNENHQKPSLNPSWLWNTRQAWRRCLNNISDACQRQAPGSQVRISWTWKCGNRLRVKVPKFRLETATAFAIQAASPNADTVTTQRPSATSLSASSSSQASTTTDETAAYSLASGSYSPDTTPSDDEQNPSEPPFIPAGGKKFLLCGAEFFQRMRNAYYASRKTSSWNPLLIPKTMQYIKFQVLFLQKSGEVVGSYQSNPIPSQKEVFRQEYTFHPCPPQIGDLPMPPEIFMHAFLDPGDHLGPMVVEILPKKLWAGLRWDGQAKRELRGTSYVVTSVH
ncbi:hypothetical protein QBC36DRAFT_315348 [Triangularia setosa]|uniref:Uncharacterized protein n=1 Tax=Triangularia setosa TaxID=2587417 RepID=A0AAN6VZ12_9PEZI|nr:hypothetical protein QBC36DRAFT_315348 [Podospora setosa]